MISGEHRRFFLCIPANKQRPKKTARLPFLHAHATIVRVRTPYETSACKYCFRALTWQSHGERTLKVRSIHLPRTKRTIHATAHP